jgi:Fe2+ transport system protein FeoA
MQQLSSIVNDEPFTIGFIDAAPELVESLEVLGFTPGTKAKIISRSPFYGPIAIELHGSRFALRYEEASKILVQ